jgi:hypothetical protein
LKEGTELVLLPVKDQKMIPKRKFLKKKFKIWKNEKINLSSTRARNCF